MSAIILRSLLLFWVAILLAAARIDGSSYSYTGRFGGLWSSHDATVVLRCTARAELKPSRRARVIAAASVDSRLSALLADASNFCINHTNFRFHIADPHPFHT